MAEAAKSTRPGRSYLVGVPCSWRSYFLALQRAGRFFIARSYTEELADAYDLSRGVTRAVLWASFAAIAVFAGLTLSFSTPKRRVGYFGLLSLFIGHSLLLGRIDTNFRKNGTAERCYVMTRTSIRTLNRIGIDPDTGLECRPLTPQIVEKLEEYKNGHRPTQITSNDPKFFDAVTGEPIVWYSKNDQGQIELFDLIGFHPKTGEELAPITKQVAEDWKTQSEKVVRRVPARVADPDKFGFFDPVSGASKVWYWRSVGGEYEFYDGPGYHPRAGDQLKVITREVIADWHQWLEAVAAKARAEREQKEREARERGEREAQQAQEAAERERLAREAAAVALQKQQRSGDDCDRLAANPTDTRKASEGVPFDVLGRQAAEAFEACSQAAQTFPSELRYQYQLGRAAQFKDKKQAFDIFTRLVQAKYAAAFDNLGGMYYERNDIATAINLFTRGNELGDADSMVSLVDLIDKGLMRIPNPEQTKLNLLKRAAELGHAGAQKGYESEMQKVEQVRINQLNQQQMMQIFGTIVQRLPMR